MGRRRAHFEPGVEPGGETVEIICRMGGAGSETHRDGRRSSSYLAAVMDDGYRCEAEQEFTDAPNPKNGLAHNASKRVGYSLRAQAIALSENTFPRPTACFDSCPVSSL